MPTRLAVVTEVRKQLSRASAPFAAARCAQPAVQQAGRLIWTLFLIDIFNALFICSLITRFRNLVMREYKGKFNRAEVHKSSKFQKYCRVRNYYLLFNIGFDTAETEPSKFIFLEGAETEPSKVN